MKVEYSRLLIVLICLIIRIANADEPLKREQCRDFAGDRSNCQRFIRCFHNLRVLFTCAFGTAYVPDLQACVAKELVTDCNDTENRVEITISQNETAIDNDEYPTIEADLDALEVPLQKSLSSHGGISVTSRQFGCSSYCYNDGICVLVGQKITCRCQRGYIGVRCQIKQESSFNTRQERELCSEVVCENGGTCISSPLDGETFERCLCVAGYTGNFCEVPDPTSNQQCSTNYCQNGGTCYLLANGGIYCVCPPGVSGSICEFPNNTGTVTGCGSHNPCQNSGLCSISSIGYQCQCVSGYTGNYCQTGSAVIVRNLCLPNPCQNGGTCYLTNLTSIGFACICPSGYSGVCCDTTLASSNPCYAKPCQNGGTCQVVSSTTYRCVCPFGLLGVQCELRICDPNPCLYGGQCLPLGNTFQCKCPPQYTGRCCELLLITTPAPNPCSPQPCLNGGTCTATSATEFTCSCTASYYGRCCELRNYCQPNPCYNGGSCVATMSAYICQCTYPYSGSNCEITIAPRPPPSSCPCVVCPCSTPTSSPLNPCLPNPCQNNGACSVSQSTAQCFCQPSFTGYYCEYQRRRSLTNDICSNVTCLNGGKCYESDNQPKCDCPKSYYGERCELINRPRGCNPNPCGQDGQCVSTNEGYKCLCKNGRTGVLCEQMILPKNHRWCPLDCHAGASCVYEGSSPTCRVLNAY